MEVKLHRFIKHLLPYRSIYHTSKGSALIGGTLEQGQANMGGRFHVAQNRVTRSLNANKISKYVKKKREKNQKQTNTKLKV